MGPDGIGALLRVARHGAQFALSVNSKHFQSAGFAETLARLHQVGKIQKLRLPETRIYGDLAAGPHQDDTALIALFEKT